MTRHRRSSARAVRWAAGVVLLLSACGDPEPLPPYGQVLISVDTDAPIDVASRLRIDLYTADWTWIDSRDIPRVSDADWPASFGVYTTDESGPTVGFIRLRTYPQGKTRDYRGERFQPVPVVDEPFLPGSTSQLCEATPVFAPGDTVAVRRGQSPLVLPTATPGCPEPDKAAFVNGFAVDIPEPGTYRIEVVDVYPPDTFFPSDTQLFLRTQCDSAESQIACNDDIEPGANLLSRVQTNLDAGRVYVLLASGQADPMADLYVRVDKASDWDAFDGSSGEPRLIRSGADVTPDWEPQPQVTIDRLVSVKLQPGEVAESSVVLSGSCLGYMARIPTESDGHEAETCMADSKGLIPVPEDLPHEHVETGLFDALEQGCPEADPMTSIACVPGGYFFLGDPAGGLNECPVETLPERVAVMSPFWMDRDEVTVGAFRAALAEGLTLPDPADLETNNGPLATQTNNVKQLCTWSDTPLAGEDARESYPLNCVSWHAARAYCQQQGGDLPSEAQWEYAASAAGRPFETPYPWGGSDTDSPTCEQTVFARLTGISSIFNGLGVKIGMQLPFGMTCYAQGFPYGIQPVDSSDVLSDVTPATGIRALGGNVAEFVLDDLRAYDDPCWLGAPLRDPGCIPSQAPLRVVRGGSWGWSAAQLRASQRLGAFESATSPFVGFRCVYNVDRTWVSMSR